MQDNKCSFSEIYYPSSDGKTNIHACIWQPSGEVVAAVQIVHGMAEYAERYAPFAEALAERGFLVCAEDHLGHGKSISSLDHLGYFAEERGCMPVLKDIRALAENMKSRCEGLPYFMLGHSMGSFFVRKYASLYGDELAGAVIMGTGCKGGAAILAGKALCAVTGLFRGYGSRPSFIEKLAFKGYNSRFAGRTSFDWLSSVDANVDKYIDDPLCGVPFTCNGFYGLFDIIGKACSKKTVAATPDKLPLFFVSGDCDPVGDYGKGVRRAYEMYKKQGKNVSLKLYEGCRHELLNEVCAEQVTADILNFFTEIIGNGRQA